MEPTLAIAASVRGWPDALRRHLAEHGGARIRLTAMTPEVLGREQFDVLVIDDLCSFLTPRIVAELRAAGRQVVGVYHAGEAPEGRNRLAGCGVGLLVDEREGPAGIIAAASAPTPEPEVQSSGSRSARGRILVVGGPRGGCGRTEVATALAAHLARVEGPAILVDLDVDHPGVAIRLGLALHPNLATALDHHRHGSSDPEDAIQWSRRLGVLVGRPRGVHRATWSHDVAGLVERLAGGAAWLVADVGEAGLGPVERILGARDRVVVVGAPDPLGVARLVEWYAELADPRPSVDVLVNRAPASSFLRAEIAGEIIRSIPTAGFGFLPLDGSVSAAAWDGVPVRKGAFQRSLTRWAVRSLSRMAA